MNQGATVRKRWTGLATSVAIVASILAVNNAIGAKADDAAGQSWTLYAAGDVASPNSGGDEQIAALIKQGIAADPDHTRVAMLGDGAYPDGSLDTYNREYGKAGSWGDFKDKTYPVPGNHDYGTDMGPLDDGYREYWKSRLQEFEDAGGQTMSSDSGWYSVEFGNWHLIALNWACGVPKPGNTVKGSGIPCDETGPQAQWLATDLQHAKAANKH